MQSNPLQSQQQEWLIGLNNRLIDMNERLKCESRQGAMNVWV